MNEHDQRIIHSSGESDWRTPPECFRELDEEFDFVLDAAADEASVLGENREYLGPDHYNPALRNALVVDWYEHREPYGAIFLNPPFSRTKAREYHGTPNPYLISNWAKKCWEESQRGCTIVALMPFTPQTEWYRYYVLGHSEDFRGWSGHAAKEERRLPHRISFLRPDGSDAANAGVNTVVIVWAPMKGAVGPWQPHSYYWSYR